MEKQMNSQVIAKQFLHVFEHLHNGSIHSDCRRLLGYELKRCKSSIPNAGRGVFLSGKASAGTPVAIYPGTIFLPGDPSLLPSIRNNYLLRRSDGALIDGKPFGLSRLIFSSCASRNYVDGNIELQDETWLKEEGNTRNPLSIGHMINHRPDDGEPNVMYTEFEFESVPLEYRRYIPHVYYSSHETEEHQLPIKSIAMVAVRDVEDEELFSDYCFIATSQ
ncbi:hypothetical protein PROFUN_13475 [Planoprotostelium fungivorum]|uniref:SET domain-containing protein n=1 Tax=Planoprotostelium fungivorum TaxID=1890364 RepID=A0A2P6N3W7_9EUKA|nr:hypothetical protein PROFUN_13475 [Planoprotostelium fungivorum]